MEILNKNEKALILLFSYIILLFTIKSNGKDGESIITYNDSYDKSCTLPYAYYNDKCVFIGDDETISLIKDECDDNLYIVDDRYSSNPAIGIYDSYKIKDVNTMKNILKILEKYEQEYPSFWNRSISSMEREWVIHNICYNLKYERFRTGKVDLDNMDESNYDNLFHLLLQSEEIIKTEVENDDTLKRVLSKND